MFITTKAEFIWDSSLSKYVEVSNDGYEYNGEVSKCHGDHSANPDLGESNPYDPNYDFEQFSYWQTTHSAVHGGNMDLDETGGDDLTMQDFVDLSGEELMEEMGYDPADVEKYGEFVPEYDPWREEFALDRRDLERDIGALKTSQLAGRGEALKKSFGFQMEDIQQKMGGALGQGEQSLYNIYTQGQQVAAGGLGGRSGISRRARRGISGEVGAALGGFRSQGLQMENQLLASLSDLSTEAGILKFKDDLSALDYQEDITGARAEHTDEVWDYLRSLLMQDTSIAPSED